MKGLRTLYTLCPALMAAGLCLTGPALADELPTITIGAGTVTTSTVGRSSIGARLEQVTVTHRVSYADLDLTTRNGADELDKRVKDTARMACKQLDELYPMETKNARECTKAAIAQASAQVKNAIAGARREANAE